ncbi:hypothetical protein ACOME3_005128 [Neoechinorhynchus agilis]
MASQCSPHGFCFDNFERNNILLENSTKSAVPRVIKTGTTLCAVVFKDGVVIGADTRSTAGDMVSEKNCLKVHRIADNIYCLGAGTAADCDFQTRLMESQMELVALETGRQIRLSMVVRRLRQRLYRYMGYIGAYLIIGGVDITGPQVSIVHAHGSTANLPYITSGSGGYAALAVCEDGYRKDMSEQDAMELVKRSIETAILNDMYSGTNVDLCVVTRENTRFIRPYAVIGKPEPRLGDYTFKSGITPIVSKMVKHVPYDDIVEEKNKSGDESEEMDVSPI